MKWKIKNGLVLDENGDVVLIIPENASEETERTLEVAPQAIMAIAKFVDDVNSGKLKPRSAVKEFEKILEQYNA